MHHPRIYVRFTGTHAGSTWYKAGDGKYAFGQNIAHFQQGVYTWHWPALKAKYGPLLLEVPVEKIRRAMTLDANTATAALPELTREVKDALIGAGLVTLGMVLAEDPAKLVAILGNAAGAIRLAIGLHVGFYAIGDDDLPKVTTNAAGTQEPAHSDNAPAMDGDSATGIPMQPKRKKNRIAPESEKTILDNAV